MFQVHLNENCSVDASDPDNPQCSSSTNSDDLKVTNVEIHRAVDGTYECSLCKARFPFQSSARSHASHTHRKERPDERLNVIIIGGQYECDKCDSTFDSKDTLKMHYSSSHGPFECDICHRIFNTRASLKMHYRVHTEEKPYDCHICGDLFGFKNNLKRHFISHVNEGLSIKQENSQETPSVLPNYSELTNVSPLIKNEVYYEDKITSNSACANIAMFQCEMCSERFFDKLTLDKHSLIHEMGNCYQCQLCRKYFLTAEELSAHSKVHAKGKDKPFQCETCHKGFMHHSNLLAHYMTHVKKQSNKALPNQQAYDLNHEQLIQNFTNDLSKKPNECNICQKRFKLESSLLTHYITHDKKK